MDKAARKLKLLFRPPSLLTGFFICLFLLSLPFTTTTQASTWQDVSDVLNDETYPGCTRWVEEVENEDGSKCYKVWERCGAWGRGAMSDPYITFSPPSAHCNVDWYSCYGRKLPGNTTYRIGFIGGGDWYAWAVDSCYNSSQVKYQWPSNLVDCTMFDTLIDEFCDVEECYDKINGVFTSCGQSCSPPNDLSNPAEVCGDGIDNNCDGDIDEGCDQCEDNDVDGYDAFDPESCPEGDDCDDFNDNINPGAEEVCDGEDNNCDDKTDEGCCELDNITVYPSWVWPKRTGGNTIAEVFVELANPAPLEGCRVGFEVEPVSLSGGHNHDGGRPADKTGTISGDNPLRFYSEEKGPKTVTYISSDVSGVEKIKATVYETNESMESGIIVRVIGLSPLSKSPYYRLTGQTTTHPVNHYGTLSTKININFIAEDFYDKFKASLGINDMSLEWGGLFDICATWYPKDTCSNAPRGGHFSHMKGTGVDIDSKAPGYNGWISVDRTYIKTTCERYGGHLLRESTLHCEFSK